jgi:hypothetical protein
VSDILRALLMSAGVLLPIVVLIIVVGRVAVLRGEAGHHGELATEPGLHGGAVADAKPAAAQKGAAAAAVSQDVSVLEILGLGTALFVIAIVVLLGISIIRHM